jgi:hypothetical protein
MRSLIRRLGAVALLSGLGLVVACGEAEPPPYAGGQPGVPAGASGKSDGAGAVVDQASPDVTVLWAQALDPIGGYGEPGFDATECTPVDSFSMDCTARFEERFGRPALHPIVVSSSQSQFFCRVLEVETLSRSAALAASDGIGFYYRGYGQSGLRFVPRDRLVSAGQSTLANGEAAERHAFIGLANCWLGSASSSSRATYELKPFMQFTAGDSGIRYRNWDEANNYVLSTRVDRFDRSGELLE